MPGKTLNVWQHFLSTSFDRVAVCKHCKQQMSCCQSTGSLLIHMKAKHDFFNLSGQLNSGDGATGCTSHLEPALKHWKLMSFMTTPVVNPVKITEFIINTIVGDLRPTSLAEGENFKKLIKELAPGYEIPCHPTIINKIEEKFISCKVMMRKL